MAHDIRPVSITCAEDSHEPCVMKGCHCECHLPQERQSVYWRLGRLGKSTLPDSERLQVLIQLTTELAQRR